MNTTKHHRKTTTILHCTLENMTCSCVCDIRYIQIIFTYPCFNLIPITTFQLTWVGGIPLTVLTPPHICACSRTWISTPYVVVFLYSIIWCERGLFYCWYWWNCWLSPSLFQLSFPNFTTFSCSWILQIFIELVLYILQLIVYLFLNKKYT